MVTVMACGCFDLLHAGHIRHLAAARRLGDRLVVLLTPDARVAMEKGAGRPVLSGVERADLLRQLRCVDNVVLNCWPTAADALRSLRPDVYVKGLEYEGRPTDSLRNEMAALKEYGGRLAFVGEELIHTSQLIGHVSQEVPG